MTNYAQKNIKMAEIERQRSLLHRNIAAFETNLATRERNFRSVFAAAIAISCGAAMVVMAALVVSNIVDAGPLAYKFAPVVLFFGVFGIAAGYHILPADLELGDIFD